jgi:hypothetical protein
MLTMFRAASCSAAALAASCCLTLPAIAAPPVSDGSSGSFDAQFGDGSCEVWFNVDTGKVWCSDSGGFVKFTVPYKSVKWNGQRLHAYNFTDMNVQPGVKIAIVGNTPAMFLAQQDINLAGQFTIVANSGKGGAPTTPDVGSYKGGDGTGPNGGIGGQGGYGPGGETSGATCTEPYTAAGGGGGGNAKAGKPGFPGDWPTDGQNNGANAQSGAGGAQEAATLLQGGEGGGAGGGGYYRGNFYAWPGADGGGAVVFSTQGAISVASTGLVDASGHNGIVWQYVSGGGGAGAGGDVWFYAAGTFSNSGLVSAHGGAGGYSKYTANCAGTAFLRGPDGGSGSAGHVRVKAATFNNRGFIDVAGSEESAGGDALEVVAHVIREGTIKPQQLWQARH